jgi:LacI family transcriptional regulator, galactose operon repressor
MAVRWTLRKWLAVTHDVYRTADLRRRILEATGVDLSAPALGAMMRETPRALRFSTIEAICTTFQCQLSDFCQVIPGPVRRRSPHQLYPGHGRRTKAREVGDFPKPSAFPVTAPPTLATRRRKPNKT